MISYTALVLAILGSIWTIIIIAQIVTRKSKITKAPLFKRLFKNMAPFLSRTYPRESMEFLFSQALKTLKSFIPSKDYKYQLPWYMAIGSCVGKTTFFRSLKLEAPIDSEEFCSENSLCYWHFFNNGVFLDIKSLLVKNNENPPTSDEGQWNKLINLINKVRPNKGLDGILLFVSVEDLIGYKAKNEAQLMQDGEYIYTKLWQLQKKLELKLPIYIVFTHLDSLNGFSEFAKALPVNLLQDVFGWSCPYSLDNSFQDSWVENMFDTMDERIAQIQSEIFVNKGQELNAEVIEFFSNFRKLANPLKFYMNRVFQENQYAAGYFLRGIYFVGAEYMSSELTTEKWPKLPGVENKLLLNSYIQHLFATNILTKKVFLEKNLARIIGQASASYRMQLRLIELALGLFATASVVYLTNSYMKLSMKMNIINPRVVKIGQLLNEHSNSKLYIDDSVLMAQAQELLNAIVNISQINLKFAFIPISWVSSLEMKLNKLIEQSNNLIIVKAVMMKIEERYKELANMEINHISLEMQAEIKNLKNPLEHPSYKKLHHFIEKVTALNQIEQKFISASENGNVISYAWLIKKLLGVHIPSKFYTAHHMFSIALRENAANNINLSEYQQRIRGNVDKLFDNFINYGFVLHNFSENFAQLNETFYKLENNSESFSMHNLRMLQDQISELITFINGPKFAWMQYSNFQLKKFIGLMQYVKNVQLLGADYAKNIEARVNKQFVMLKFNMQVIKIPVIGNIFYLDGQNMLKIADNLYAMQGLLNNLFAEKFMEDVENKDITNIKYGQTTIWNIDVLNGIVDLFNNYDEFIRSKLSAYPAHLVKMLKLVTRNNLDQMVRTRLADSQQITNIDYTTANIMAISENIKGSYAAISNILKNLKQLDLPTFDKLLTLEKERSMQVINSADNLLETENLYDVQDNEISIDNMLKNKLYFSFDINEYLMIQRNKIMHFAKDIVEPVVKTLTLIDQLDNATFITKIEKWVGILKDVDLYSSNSQASNLFKLENFFKQLEVLKPQDLSILIADNPKLRLKADNYFEAKLVKLKRGLFKRTNLFVQQTVDDNVANSFAFYNQYIKFFPFNLTGPLLPVDAIGKLDDLLKNQAVQMEMLSKISPDVKMPNMRFIEGLARIYKLMQFLTMPDGVLILNVKTPSEFSESYEKNLEYLVTISATVGANKLFFPDSGSLKVKDKIVFYFKLANQSNMSFATVNDKAYSSNELEMVITLNKQDLVCLLLKNGIVKNGQTILKFDLPMMDKEGNKHILVFAVPIELAQEGGVVFSLPDSPMSILARNVKV